MNSGVSPTEPGTFVHTVRLFHTADGVKDRAVYVENNFSFGDSSNHHDVDLFMRLRTGVKNGERAPVFYGDMNGLQMQRRTKVTYAIKMDTICVLGQFRDSLLGVPFLAIEVVKPVRFQY